jgi:hypothetical protein
MFHNHTTSRHIYITADKLCLNKLSQSTTHLSCVKLLSPRKAKHRVTSTSTCLNFFQCYWLPSFPRSPRQLKQQVSCHMPALPNAGLCRSQNSYNQLLATRYNFSVVLADWVVGTDWPQSLHCGWNMTPPPQPWGCIILLCETWWKWPWRLTYMNWPHHLNAAFWKQNEWRLGEIL